MNAEMITTKLNESYSLLTADENKLRDIFNFLKVERTGARFEFLVKCGRESPYNFFSSVQNKKLLVMNGHLQLLKTFGVESPKLQSEFTESEIVEYLDSVKSLLPFPPYDFQEKAFKESILNVRQLNKMCTGSGKSCTISLIAEFFRRKGMKGLLLVPNINLLTQFKNDIADYNLTDLYNDTHTIGGGESIRHFNNSLTISTWQSLQDKGNANLAELDYVICDEVHRFASEVTSSIVMETINCRYKWGFTGTLPEDPTMKMQLLGLFGLPKTYITSRELIERGLATPIKINAIIFNYNSNDTNIFREIKKTNYSQQLKFIEEHEARNEFVVNLACKLKGNSLVLFQHTNHGKSLFIEIMRKLYPDVDVENKNITGKKSFEFQEQYNVFFLNGEDDAKTRELTRKILEEKDNAILVSGYQLLSTGVNIRRLHNMILASPLKAHTTITQSIGRLMRLHESKKEAIVFDLIDSFGIRKPTGIFYQQYQHRKNTSYNVEEYPINEVFFQLS